MKEKVCSFCGRSGKLWFSKPPTCMAGECRKKAQEERSSKSGTKTPERKQGRYNSSIKPKPRKATGEYNLFLKIYAERKGICQITGEQIQFEVDCFAHILSKGAYESLRLDPENILLCKKEIHHLYDNSSKDKLLAAYPKAEIIYELKDKLRYKYYNPWK